MKSLKHIPYSCPLIDKVIKVISTCQELSCTRGIDETDENVTLISLLDGINMELYGQESELEHIRSINDDLRVLARDQEQDLETLQQQCYDLEKLNNDLNDEICELKRYIAELESEKWIK